MNAFANHFSFEFRTGIRDKTLLLPATHAMNAFQGLAQNQVATFDPLWSVLILLAGGILSFGLANYLFCWDSQNKTRRGHPALALLALLPYAVGVVLL